MDATFSQLRPKVSASTIAIVVLFIIIYLYFNFVSKAIRLLRVLASAGRHLAQWIAERGLLPSLLRFTTHEYTRAEPDGLCDCYG